MEETVVTCELEAAEALAGLSRSSAAHGSNGQLGVVASSLNRQVYSHTTMIANPEKAYLFPHTTEKPEPSHLCSKSYRSKPVGKRRQKLTEAEKEERRIRRVLANRESARQTVRRRQVMYSELRRKAADVSEENERLKKERELALENYTCLKERNEFLKAQISKVSKTKQGETQELQKKSQAKILNPIPSSNKQPSLMPYTWPSLAPYELSHSNNITVSSLLHFPHEGQERHSMGGQPVFIVPVPWLLPFLSHNNAILCNNSEAQSSCQCVMPTPLDCPHRSLSNKSVRVQGCSDSTKTKRGFNYKNGDQKNVRRNFRVDETSGLNFVSPSERVRVRSLAQKSREPQVMCSMKNASAATEVRRRRKELMKMKDIRLHRTNTG